MFMMGSHILTFSIMLNVTTGHGACTIVFTIVGLLVSLVCTVPRTMRMVSYFSVVSFASILGAVFITMIGVGVEGRTPHLEVSARPGTPFWLGFGAVGNIIFAYGGCVRVWGGMRGRVMADDAQRAIWPSFRLFPR